MPRESLKRGEFILQSEHSVITLRYSRQSHRPAPRVHRQKCVFYLFNSFPYERFRLGELRRVEKEKKTSPAQYAIITTCPGKREKIREKIIRRCHSPDPGGGGVASRAFTIVTNTYQSIIFRSIRRCEYNIASLCRYLRGMFARSVPVALQSPGETRFPSRLGVAAVRRFIISKAECERLLIFRCALHARVRF